MNFPTFFHPTQHVSRVFLHVTFGQTKRPCTEGNLQFELNSELFQNGYQIIPSVSFDTKDTTSTLDSFFRTSESFDMDRCCNGHFRNPQVQQRFRFSSAGVKRRFELVSPVPSSLHTLSSSFQLAIRLELGISNLKTIDSVFGDETYLAVVNLNCSDKVEWCKTWGGESREMLQQRNGLLWHVFSALTGS